MKNMKRWKRLLAVGMCSAMMFSMSVGVSATEDHYTAEKVVETEKDEETGSEIRRGPCRGISGDTCPLYDAPPKSVKENAVADGNSLQVAARDRYDTEDGKQI